MVIDGRFELRERLGSGGMGTVWRAYDLALHREVALKEVRLADPDGDASTARMRRERVLREARALARIHHPNVVTVHHIVDSPGVTHPWIVMELVRGRSLQQILAHGPLPAQQAARLGRGILAALQAAHQAGILHRDVKPANVLVREDGTPVLTDFGIAALRESPGLTGTGELVGSPEYIAPERLRGDEGDPASDLWSLGLLLYVAVEGHNPLRRETAMATLAAVLNAQVPPARRAGPLAPVLHALLTPNPAARPRAAQLDWMLAQAESGHGQPVSPHPGPHPGAHPGPVMGRPTGPTMAAGFPGKPRPAGPRRRGLAAGIAAAAVAIAAGTVVLITTLPGSGSRGTALTPMSTPTGSVRTKDVQTSEPVDDAETAPAADLLTPGGMRQMIAAFEKASGQRRFVRLVVYPTYAAAEIPVPEKGKVYDNYSYRDGVATRVSPGSTLRDTALVDVGSVDWDLLPKMLSTAESRAGVGKPTTRYLIIEPDWAFDAAKAPVVLVYIGDDYGSGYVAFTTRGKVLHVVKKGG